MFIALLHKSRTSFKELYSMPHNSVFCSPSENSPLNTVIYSIPSCDCLPRAKNGNVISSCQDLKICRAMAGAISAKIKCTVLEG